ncbi:MAG: BNR repeat-containing protein [Deltaproteobacteria bacterium]|nr:BNR repeat-containing protein [Deltaproteobacteria bacterium]
MFDRTCQTPPISGPADGLPSPSASSSPNIANSTIIAKGWARNSINAVIFRHNSLVTHGRRQYAAFYGRRGRVILAKRKLGSGYWEVAKTPYKGRVRDAHNSISIMVDGNGYLHMAWNQHDSPLNYCRSKAPHSLELGPPTAMTGIKERRVTYPEFHRLPDGDLIFTFRDGSSGKGNLMMNRYDSKAGTWTQLQDDLVDGQRQRSAYHQIAIDRRGVIHLSWVWRETADVATNHDLCYAKSPDGGRTWLRSDGSPYQLPITAASAEYAWRIPPNSSLINQTSMAVDSSGAPCIATYWAPEGSGVPQYFVVFRQGGSWRAHQVSRRTTPFELGGQGTLRIPISRPLILLAEREGRTRVYLVFRDVERGDRVSLAVCEDLHNPGWRCQDLTSEPVGAWEPTFDSELWRQKQVLHLLVQRVGQRSWERLQRLTPQPVSVLQWQPPI